MKLNIIRTILIIALITIFTTIFGFSNQDSETSGGISQKVTEYITRYIPAIQRMKEFEKEEITDKVETAIRKIDNYIPYNIKDENFIPYIRQNSQDIIRKTLLSNYEYERLKKEIL